MEIRIKYEDEKQKITEPCKWAEPEPRWRTEAVALTELGYRVVGEIIAIAGECWWGHKVGDKFILSTWENLPFSTNSCKQPLCGMFLNHIYPYICVLQWGGKWPAYWDGVGQTGEQMVMICPDNFNAAQIKLSRQPYTPGMPEPPLPPEYQSRRTS